MHFRLRRIEKNRSKKEPREDMMQILTEKIIKLLQNVLIALMGVMVLDVTWQIVSQRIYGRTGGIFADMDRTFGCQLCPVYPRSFGDRYSDFQIAWKAETGGGNNNPFDYFLVRLFCAGMGRYQAGEYHLYAPTGLAGYGRPDELYLSRPAFVRAAHDVFFIALYNRCVQAKTDGACLVKAR